MMVEGEKQQGDLSRVHSSLELLCHTAVLQNDMENGESKGLKGKKQQSSLEETQTERFTTSEFSAIPTSSSTNPKNQDNIAGVTILPKFRSTGSLNQPSPHPSLPRIKAIKSRNDFTVGLVGTGPSLSGVSGFPWGEEATSIPKSHSPDSEDDYALAYDHYEPLPRANSTLKPRAMELTTDARDDHEYTSIGGHYENHRHMSPCPPQYDYASAFAAATSSRLVEHQKQQEQQNTVRDTRGRTDSAPAPRVITASLPLSLQESSPATKEPITATPEVAALIAKTLEHENLRLRDELASRDDTITSLKKRVAELEKHVQDLRELPTGKISQIPIADMLEIMHEYGSEVSENAVPPRKDNVQKASVVRQFRRWNPNFLEFFIHKGGKWIPKLGKKGELERRANVRSEASKKRPGGNSTKQNGSRATSPVSPPTRGRSNYAQGGVNSCSSSLSSGSNHVNRRDVTRRNSINQEQHQGSSLTVTPSTMTVVYKYEI